MFQIIELRAQSRDGEPLRRANGTLRLYRTGKGAARVALALSRKTGKKYQPRPFAAEDWRQRELNRFADNTYALLPWHDTKWWKLITKDGARCALHYAHVSKQHPGKVAFTETEAKGLSDLHTAMRAGRYLQRFVPGLSVTDVAEWACRFSMQFESGLLQFADTREDIREVYRNGPTSCMSHAASDYVCRPVHPTEVYASPNMAIAYMSREGRITARTVVNTESKRYYNIYGDAFRLEALLKENGFRSGPLQGGKLLKIPVTAQRKGTWAMAYIDGLGKIRDDGEYFVIDGDGDIDAFCSSGVIFWREPGTYCYRCEREDRPLVTLERSWCYPCFERTFDICVECKYPIERHMLRNLENEAGTKIEACCHACIQHGLDQRRLARDRLANCYGHVRSMMVTRDAGPLLQSTYQRYLKSRTTVHCDTCGLTWLEKDRQDCSCNRTHAPDDINTSTASNAYIYKVLTLKE